MSIDTSPQPGLALRPPPAADLESAIARATKALLALSTVLMVLSLLDAPECPFPLWGKFLAVGLSLRPIEGDLVHGNVNLFILFLTASSLYAFCRYREYPAGLLLGLAIACKLTPALFIPYFLWKRAWKTLLGTSLGFTREDYGADLGGFILKDRIWFFAAYDRVTNTTTSLLTAGPNEGAAAAAFRKNVSACFRCPRSSATYPSPASASAPDGRKVSACW